MNRGRHFWIGVALALWGIGRARAAAEGERFFTEKIQPILEQHCYKCHSAKAEKIKGGLLLDSHEGLMKGGDTGPTLSPGDPDNSRMVIAVRHSDPDLRMPPKEKLPDDQIALIEQWVKLGAPDPRQPQNTGGASARGLWSTRPIQRAEPPAVKNQAWVRDPVDAFILAELEKRQLPPAPFADKRTLIRRVTFDLTGLPPSPEEVEEFVRDASDKAFERVASRLLESPHFGERWGRHWLDVARFADSNGLDQNTLFASAWRYRDYVVQAFNQDKPYNEFIREQIAGDLLPFQSNEERHEKWIATGFLVIGPKNFAEPNREKLLLDVADEQIDVTCRAFLGLTASCARCHDHKFDPIPTRDYYSLAGIFRSTQTVSVEARRGPNDSPLSERPLGTPEQAARVEAYQAKLAELERKRDRARQMARELPGGIDSKELDGIVVDNLDAELMGEWKLSNYSTNFVDKNYLHDGNEKSGKGKKSVRFRPDVPEPGFYEIRLAYTARANRSTNVPVRVEGAGLSKTVYLNQTVEPKYDKAFESLGFFKLEKGTNNVVEVLTEGTRGFVVVDAIQCLPQDVQLAARLTRKRSLPPEESMMMGDVSAARREEYENAVSELMADAPPPMPMALAVRDGEPRNLRVLTRGDLERPGEEAPRGFLSLVGSIGQARPGADSSGRLALADWIASDKNPLTARVMANRIWLHLFGRGLVNTPDNFGTMGEAPANAELLDYLASEFMAGGWSTRKMIRRLVLSSTYQLSSAYNPATFAADPDNRLCWRMNRKRLDAEELRDAILAANRSLDLTLGGESLGQNQNPGPAAGADPNVLASRRRSLYLPVLRGSLNELYQAFDFPDPHALAGKRYVTTAATQALFLMNSPFATQESKRWAEKLLSQSDKNENELAGAAYAAAFARPCTTAEQIRAANFIRDFSNALIPSEPDATRRKKKAVEAFCQALIESTEFRFLN